MKKLCLLLCFISLLGCSSKVNYKLPTYDAKNPKNLLENYYNLTYKKNNNVDYTHEYTIFNPNISLDIEYYLFNYDDLDIVMTSLDEYRCYKEKNKMLDKEKIKKFKHCPNMYELVEEFGLPSSSSVGARGDSIEYITLDGYIYTFGQFYFNGQKNFCFQYLIEYDPNLKKCQTIYMYNYDSKTDEYISID